MHAGDAEGPDNSFTTWKKSAKGRGARFKTRGRRLQSDLQAGWNAVREATNDAAPTAGNGSARAVKQNPANNAVTRAVAAPASTAAGVKAAARAGTAAAGASVTEAAAAAAADAEAAKGPAGDSRWPQQGTEASAAL